MKTICCIPKCISDVVVNEANNIVSVFVSEQTIILFEQVKNILMKYTGFNIMDLFKYLTILTLVCWFVNWYCEICKFIKCIPRVIKKLLCRKKPCHKSSCDSSSSKSCNSSSSSKSCDSSSSSTCHKPSDDSSQCYTYTCTKDCESSTTSCPKPCPNPKPKPCPKSCPKSDSCSKSNNYSYSNNCSSFSSYSCSNINL